MKKVPTYWWDFGDDGEIIVESDSDKYPVVGRFMYESSDRSGCAEGAIAQAESLIKELNEGRATPCPR
jgi:hypothetical protein